MTSCDFLTTETHGKSIERSKLQTTVACNARNRSLAAQVTGYKRLNYVALEVAFQVENIERKAEFFSNAARVVDVIERTTTRWKGIAILVGVNSASLIPQLHRKTN